MNRDDLIKAATAGIAMGDIRGTNYDYRCMCYLGAIAKLLLAEAVDAPASRQAFYRRDLCTVCARPRIECTCGSPRITDESEWLPGDPV